MNRPACCICIGEIPRSLLSDNDVRADREASRRQGIKPRHWYCSMDCFRIGRELNTTTLGSKAHTTALEARLQAAKSTESPETLQTGVLL